MVSAIKSSNFGTIINPELFLNSDDSKDIEEPLLISLLENDDLVVKEIDAWNCIIEWGTAKIENLEKKCYRLGE